MQVDLKTVAADFITKEVSRTVGATVDRATMVKGPCPTTHLPHPTCYEAQGLGPTPSLASSDPWAY
jgi:hypothetical protein